MKLILLRHGESQWNLENRFTGWKDVSLTELGEKEAEFAGEKIQSLNISIDSFYTSLLKRATHTSQIVAKSIDYKLDKIQYNWRLNERHYGNLEGLNKSETASKYGEDQVHIWRRSFDIAPPQLDINDPRHPKFNKLFKSIKDKLPVGESLKDVIERIDPFWKFYNENILKKFENNLIIAHSNSLRAIIKMIEKLSNEEIISVNIPTGVPLVYDLSDNLEVLNKKFLISDKELKKLQSKIVNQGKAN